MLAKEVPQVQQGQWDLPVQQVHRVLMETWDHQEIRVQEE